MYERSYCGQCNKDVLYDMKKTVFDEFRGIQLNVEVEVPICRECGNRIAMQAIDSNISRIIFRKYRDIMGMTQPEEVVALREKVGVSLEEMTSILGWGRLALKSFEKGSIQTEEQEKVFKRLVSEESYFYELLMSAYSLGRIEKEVYDRLKKDGLDSQLQDHLCMVRLLSNKLTHVESVYNGYVQFSYEKVENLIGYISSKVENLYKTSLNKYLWYIDFLYFKKYSKSLTGLRYVKFKYGPVIEDKKYEMLIELKDTFTTTDSLVGAYIVTKIESKYNYDRRVFTKEEYEVIDHVIKTLSILSVNDISELSHDEKGWEDTDMNKLISYDYAKFLKI